MIPGVSDWCYRRRKAIAILGAAGFAVYCSNKLYNTRKAATAKSYIVKLWEAGQALSGAYVSTAEVVKLLANDLHSFISSDAHEVPQSFVQLAKLVQHKEVQAAIECTMKSSVASTVEHISSSVAPTLLEIVDKLIAATLSEQGRSVITLAAGLAAKNAVTAMCENLNNGGQSSTSSTSNSLQQLFTVLTSDDGERLLRTLIAASTTSAVGTYVDKTAHINVCDDVLSSISRKEHLASVQDILATVTRVFVQELAACYSAVSDSASRRGSHGSSEGSSEQMQAHSSDISTKDIVPTRSQLGGVGPAKSSTSSALPQTPAWLNTVVTLTRQPEVQSLAVALTKSTVHEVVDTLVNSDGPAGMKYYLGLSASKMYTVMSVMSALLLYAVST